MSDIHTKGIDEDGLVMDAGYIVETHYRPCECVAQGRDENYIRVIIDDGAVDIETRIAHDTLIKAGWTRQEAQP